MRINIDILADELADYDPLPFNASPLELNLCRFDIFKDQDFLSRDCLYVIEGDRLTPKLASEEGANWLCLGEVNNYILQYKKSNMLILPRTRLTPQIYPILSGIFSLYTEWSDKVLSMSLQDDGIRRLFNSGVLEERFKNPMLMQNREGLYGISCGELPDDFDNSEWIDLAGRKDTGSERPIENLRDQQIKDAIAEPYVSKKTNNYSFLTTNAIVDGVFQGKITHCDACRPFTPGYRALAAWFNTVLATIIERNVKDGFVGQGENNAFVELLNSWHTDGDWLDYQLRMMGWERFQPVFLVVTKLKNSSLKLDGNCSRIIKERFEVIFPCERCFEHENGIVSIVRCAHHPYKIELLKQRLSRAFAADEVVCAVSSVFYDIGRIRSFYKQCAFLLDDGVEDDGFVRFYGSAFFRHFLNEYGIDRSYSWIIDPKVDVLRAYDDKNKTNLVECVKTFIECGFNKKRAAQRMSIHYNTLTYRLSRIKEIAMIDLESAESEMEDDLFRILLSAKLIEECGRGGRFGDLR